MKKLAIAVTLSASLLGLSACSSDDSAVVETKAGDIKKEDFYKELKDRSGKEILQKMVMTKVLEDKYKVSDKEVDAELKKVKEELGDNYKQTLESEGLTEKQLKEMLYSNLLQAKALTDGIKVNDKDVKAKYDRMKTEVKARHILIKDKATAEKVKKELDNGGDFAKLAKKYSEDPGSKEQGGELGYFSSGKMDAAFEEAAFKLKKGEVSGLVQSNYGYHIIQVEDKRDKKDTPSYDELKDSIRRELALEKVDQVKGQEKIEKMIKDAKIKVKDKQFKDLFKDGLNSEGTPQG